MKHECFSFSDPFELEEKIRALGVSVPLCDDLSVFGEPCSFARSTAGNRFAVLPMEGCDSLPDGTPNDLVRRRYLSYADGGAGLIWWEACAVRAEGRANPRQLMLTQSNQKAFSELLHEVKARAAAHGSAPINILQLTHSGRYAAPYSGAPGPLPVTHDPLLDSAQNIEKDAAVLSDAYLDDLIGDYARTARLAREAGFDGVDVKACHRYLISELLSARTREGRYGGSFENRTRFLREIVRAVRRETGPEFLIACRFNAFDAHPYPYGFGVSQEDAFRPEPSEPLALAKMLAAEGVGLLSPSAGNPYYQNPEVTRPFDLPVTPQKDTPYAREHPIESAARLFWLTGEIKKAVGDTAVVGAGYSWFRQFFPYVGAANLKQGKCDFVGLGRLSFAYPSAIREVLHGGLPDPCKCCISCSKCSYLMRKHSITGCAIRNSDYQKVLAEVLRAGS